MKDIAIKHKDYFLQGVLHESKVQPAKATVIISHGFRGSKEGGGRAKVLSELACEHFDVIRYDFTPLGTLTNQMQELAAVIAYAKTELGLPIILFGRSMGGCASLLTAVQRDDINGLILWSMPFDAKATFILSLGKENIEKLQNGLSVSLDDEWGKTTLQSGFYEDLIAHDICKALQELEDMPVLFVHGEFDEIVPLEHAKKAFEVCAGKKSFAMIKDGDHRFINGFEQSKQAVLVWLADNF